MSGRRQPNISRIEQDFNEAANALCYMQHIFSRGLQEARNDLDNVEAHIDILPLLMDLVRGEGKSQSDYVEQLIESNAYQARLKSVQEFTNFLNGEEKRLNKPLLADLDLPTDPVVFQRAVFLFPKTNSSIKIIKEMESEFKKILPALQEQQNRFLSHAKRRSRSLPIGFTEYRKKEKEFNQKYAELSSYAQRRDLAIRTFPGLISQFTLHVA